MMARILIVFIALPVLIWTAVSVFARGVKYAAIDAYTDCMIEISQITKIWNEKKIPTIERDDDE